MKRTQTGFTLIELIIVVIVFAVFAVLIGGGLVFGSKTFFREAPIQPQVQKAPSDLVPRCSGGFLLNGETVMTTPDRKAIRC